MKKTLGALFTAALMTVSANATVTVTGSVQSGGYAASGTTTAGSTLFDFDTLGTLLGTSGGFTFNNNNMNAFGATVLATHANVAAGNGINNSAPAGDSSSYLSIYSGGYETVTNTAQGYNTLSLYWGTPDSFNTIDLLDATGTSIATITASDVTGLSALSATAGAVTLTASQNFYGAKFSSSSNAFELDNVRFSNVVATGGTGTSTSAVPEPATWAMMIVGFGAVGSVARRRKGSLALPSIG